ncbi:MAG: hypothetical protein KBF83_02800 [Pyrinomonadaceae bacterium]|nr:hypothetical protein [Pyrinomonadaceae bacterium]MBP9108464.1 hypothetical protein [Pyrinomonadaceae bacterium]
MDAISVPHPVLFIVARGFPGSLDRPIVTPKFRPRGGRLKYEIILDADGAVQPAAERFN